MTRRTAFTLVELLIVLAVLAILAAVVITRIADATNDAKTSTALSNLRVLRARIEVYKAEHMGKVPPNPLTNLLKTTDVWGNSGTDCGPYLQVIPPNPFTNSNKITPTTASPPTTASGISDRGWLYNAMTGGLWLDQEGYLDR